MSEENATTARRLGDRKAEARALWNVVVANVYGGGADTARAVEAGEASLAIARELGDREQVAFTLNDLARAYMAGGDFETAAERIVEARALWEDLDNRAMLGDTLGQSSHLRLLAGDHEGAMAEARAALATAESIGNRWGQAHALLAVYRIELDRGELGAAVSSIERCRELGAEGGFAYAGVVTDADLARICVYLGDVERAGALAERARESARSQLPPAAPMAAVAEAEVLVAMHDVVGARRALERVEGPMLPEPDRTLALTYAGLARARVALAAGDAEDAANAVLDVRRLLTGHGAEALVADALVVLARARLEQERMDDVERALSEAVERAERLGERLPLWEGLALTADLLERRGAVDEAAEARRRARSIVAEVANGIEDEALRRSFLARDDVVALGPV
jgi:tetratricopeptide (TPR) repeat protein